MATPDRKRATYADLATLPEDARAEVLAGELTLSPTPLPRRAAVQRAAGRFLRGPFAMTTVAAVLRVATPT